jgi:hypothetical protein
MDTITTINVVLIAGTLLAVTVEDIRSTLAALKLGAVEKNPLVRWSMGRFGTREGVVMFKSITTLLVLILLLWLVPAFGSIGQLMGWTIVIVIGIISWKNRQVVKKLR